MKSCTRLALFTVVPLLILSCAKTPTTVVTPPPSNVYSPNAITAHVKASPQLNLYDGTSHALHLCIYQLSDPNVFNQLSDTDAGISKLMRCEKFDAGVAMSHKYVFMPSEEKTVDLDRAEGARYVGIAAGYYSLQKQNSIRLYSIPMVEEKRENMIVYKYDRLVMSLFLGPQELKGLGEKQ